MYNETRIQALKDIYDNYGDVRLAAELLLSFKEYVKWVHLMANGTEYDMTEIHVRICDKLQEYTEGKNQKRNLMINVMPGIGKSLLLQYWITWNFARNKQCMFCYIAYGEKLIKKLSRDSRNLMMLPEWERLFGKEMDPQEKSVLSYHLLSGGMRSGLTAGTVQSSVLGLDAGNPASKIKFSGALLLDDPNSTEVRTSVNEQIELPETYQRKLATRRRTPDTPTICIMQRHCEADFAGWVKTHELDDWEFLIVPALDSSEKSLYEARYPTEEMLKIRKRNPILFASMYQQEPIKAEGMYFHEDWVKTYRECPTDFVKMFITTDFGFTKGGDDTVICAWGVSKDGYLFQLRSIKGKWESPDVKKNFINFYSRLKETYTKCRRVYIENTLSGIGYIQDLKRECPSMAIIPLKRGAKKSKLARVESASTWLESGKVFLREGDPNYPAFRYELITYSPSQKNPVDNFIDNLGDACEIAFNTKTSSIFI